MTEKRDITICIRLTAGEHTTLCALRAWLESQSAYHRPSLSDTVRMCMDVAWSSRLPNSKQNHAHKNQ